MLALVVASTALAHILALGNGPGADRIAWAPGAANGYSAADLPVAAVWLVTIVPAAALWRGGLPTRTRRLLVVVSAAVLTFMAVTLVKGDGPDSGTTMLAFSDAYGVNTGDLPVLAVWAAGAVACVVLWRPISRSS